MDHEHARELSAAYALDALDEVEEREFEEHLRHCPACREELATLTETAANLAYAVEAPPPPRELRDRILSQARSARGNVVELRPRRRLLVATSTAAVAAAAAAIAIAFWASSLSNTLDQERLTREILSDPQAQVVGLKGAEGRLVVDATGRAALIVSNLEPAPRGKTYEAWVIAGSKPIPAGLFDGGEPRDVVILEEPLPEDARVAVTLEPAGGVDRPTGPTLFTARA